MIRHFLIVGATTLWACSNTVETSIDAPRSIDAPAAAGSFGATCTTVSDTSTECTSHVCTNTFNMFPTPLCSQKCMAGTADPTCPSGSMGMKCNLQGYCRP